MEQVQVSAGDLLMLRRRLKLRQNEAAKVLGLNAGSLVDIEREVVKPVPEQLTALAERYDDYKTRKAAVQS